MPPRKGVPVVVLGLVAFLATPPGTLPICQDTDPLIVLGHEILPGQQVCVPPEAPSAPAPASPS